MRIALYGLETHHRATERHLPYSITQCYLPPDTGEWAQRRSQEFDLGGYKSHNIEFVLGQGDKTTP